MRAAQDREYAGILRQLREINPRAPIFRARLEHRYWVDYRTRQPHETLAVPAAAFCGFANPASFWGTLRSLGIQPVFHWAFGDHHHYNCAQVGRLAAQAQMNGSNLLLTTEKDAMNLPDSTADALERAGVELHWLKIGVRVEKEQQLLELIAAKMESYHRPPLAGRHTRHGV